MKKTFIQKDISQSLTNRFIPMKQFLTLLFLLSGFALTAQTIAVQGVLRDPRGRTVDDGFYEVVFSLYDQAADGTALWSETHPSLATKNGLFVAKLGTYQTLDIAFDTTYYLGIAIEGRVEISPRMELSLAPYALGVFGKDNYFPGVGDVRIKDSLSIAEGSLTLNEGSMLLGKGDMQLDSGNLTMQGGDIILNKEGAGIEFADGTKLTTAFGGTAANLSNPNSVIIAADTDEDGVGTIDLKIGDSTYMQINNAGRVSARKDVLLDSGQLMAKTGNDLGIGHWNPEDSTYSEVMNMNADGTVVFTGNIKAAGEATADEDLVNLGTLNSYLAPNIPDTLVEYNLDPEIGDELNGGQVFAIEEDYVYIAYAFPANNSGYYLNRYSSSWSSSRDFGTGYQNTQNLLAANPSNAGNSGSVFWYINNNSVNGYSDWFIPSADELARVFQVLSGFSAVSDNNWFASSTMCDGSSTSVIDINLSASYSCTGFAKDDFVLVRREPRDATITLQFDDNSTLTVGALQNYLPVLSENPAQQIGSDFGGGKVFANDDDFVYVAYPFFTNAYYLDNNSTSFTSSIEFGTGYDNTQTIFANATDGNSNNWEYYIQNNAPGGYTDWYIPSQGEYDSIFINTPEIMGPYTNYYLWTSSSSGTSSTSARYAYFGSSTNYNSYYSTTSLWNNYQTILIRRIPRATTYTADDNDFVTVGFLLDKIAELEQRIESLLSPAIGTETDGGVVFANEDGYTYIAYLFDNSTELSTYSGGYSSNSTFGSGYTNTQNLFSAFSNESVSNTIEYKILNNNINGYSDWFVPSSEELQRIFDNTNLADSYSSSQYFWTSEQGSCGSGWSKLALAPSGTTTCSDSETTYPFILVRRK
ncbi:MAG: hypothetical protein JXR10_17230 [Cyclobacteriaceae bacterium]